MCKYALKNIITDKSEQFEDISGIVGERKTSIAQDLNKKYSTQTAIDYNDYHEENSIRALEELMQDTPRISSYEESFCNDTLEWSKWKQRGGEPIMDRRNIEIPKVLRTKYPSSKLTDTKIRFGGFTAKIMHELGRGAHGVVLLCNILKSENQSVTHHPIPTIRKGHFLAAKVQCPMGML